MRPSFARDGAARATPRGTLVRAQSTIDVRMVRAALTLGGVDRLRMIIWI
jgi:hypothetical protein